MACDTELLKQVPLFSLLDDDERAVLAQHVELREFSPHQRIYKMGEPGGRAYIVASGKVRVSIIDEDQQELTIEEPEAGGVCGFASLLAGTPHRTTAVAVEPSTCIEVDQADLAALIQTKPHAGLDMLSVLGRQIHAAHELARTRSVRNPNEVIEEETTPGERIADHVAKFGGSWRFIITFGVLMTVYVAINIGLRTAAWDPYPFILLNLFLSMLAALQAPVIMMSQNRQDAKDRVRSELDFNINRLAESEIRGLAQQMQALHSRMSDLEESASAGKKPPS